MGMVRGDCWCCESISIYINIFSKLCKKCERKIEREVVDDLDRKNNKKE